MSKPDFKRINENRKKELNIQQQIAFTSGIFQGDVTIRTLLESLAEGVVIIDKSGIILLVNTRAEQMFDYPKNELIGKPHSVLIPELFRKVHEKHEAHFFQEPRIRPMGQLLDLAGLRRDGSEFPLEISLGFIETINGVLVMALVSDMTLRRQFEMRLRENENLFRIQVEEVKDYAVFMLDTEGKVLSWNAGAERLKGYRAEEIIGKHFSCFYPEEEQNAGKPEEELRIAAAEGRLEDEAWRLRKDGSRFWGNVIITALHDESGKLRGFSKVTRDITGRKKVEEALRESEELFRLMADTAPVLIWVSGTDTLCTFFNKPWREFTGRTLEQEQGKGWTEGVHPDDLQRCMEMYLSAFNARRNFQMEYRLRRADSEYRWIVDTGVPRFMPNGDFAGYIGSCFDITDRKRAEEALRESENKFFKAFQAMPSALIISSLADGRYKEVNEAFERVLGYRHDELIGRSAQELNIWQNPEDRTVVLRMLAEGKKVRDLEIGLRSKSGSIRVCHYSAEIIEIGAEQCLLSLVNDITDRKKAEEALSKSEKKFLTIFHAVPAILGITTVAEGKFIDVNETCMRILGYQRDEVIGHTALELGIWKSQADRDRALQALEVHRKQRSIEINLRGKGGENFVGLLSAEFIEVDGEQYILSMINDITERKRMEEEIKRLNTDLTARAAELEDANRELEAFNYTVAHDLRQPLNVISSYCQAIDMLCGDQLQEECKGYVHESYEGTLHMNRLIEALLNFSRMGHVEPGREMVDICTLAHEVATALKLTEPERQVDFRIADRIVANGDTNLLRVVLDNLIGNASKYTGMREKAVIEFGVTDIGGVPTYFVRDNGEGFDKANGDKLFAPFHRLPGAEKRRGFGIGLATVERIIRRHGGRVWGEGEPGKGATFYFTLGDDRTV